MHQFSLSQLENLMLNLQFSLSQLEKMLNLQFCLSHLENLTQLKTTQPGIVIQLKSLNQLSRVKLNQHVRLYRAVIAQ